jgi:hypothetical protein
MMWDQILSVYRGQAGNGTVVAVEPDAMELAQKKAGTGIYDSDWWVETLIVTLEHWGIYGRRWMDGATRVPRASFSLEKYTDTGKLYEGQVNTAPAASTPAPTAAPTPAPTTTSQPLNSGPLLNRLKSGPLGSRDLKR